MIACDPRKIAAQRQQWSAPLLRFRRARSVL
jgi:hypothetical protein